MWRPYLIYVVNALKVLTLGAIAVGAWFLAIWIRHGDYGVPSGSFEPYGLLTDFLGLFLLLLFVGIAIATPLLWHKRPKDSNSGEHYDWDNGI